MISLELLFRREDAIENRQNFRFPSKSEYKIILFLNLLFNYRQMLSQSMLQRFSTKIGQLVTNQQTDRFGSSSALEGSCVEKQIRQEMEIRKKQRDPSPESQYGDHRSAINGQNKKSSNNLITLDENEEGERMEKINNRQLSRLIALEKQKPLTPSKNHRIPTTVKKTVALASTSTVSSNSSVKPSQIKTNIEMPQVSVMNNLLKLSTKIQCHELLKEIKYQSLILSMASARFLLYFCIERIIFSIYLRNGAERMSQKQKDVPFLLKNVQLSLIQLILYFKNLQRSMLTRILQAVFQRFEIFPCFSEKWLAQCIRQNKKQLQDNSINAQELEKIPSNSSITSNIFLGIPSLNRKILYDFPALELEDEEYSQDKIQDPQIFHSQQRLFFFKKSFDKQKFTNKTQKSQVQNRKQKPNSNLLRGPSYNLCSFKVQMEKLSIPGGVKIVRSLDDHGIENPNDYNEQIQAKTRKRNRMVGVEDWQQQAKTDGNKPRTKITKEKIAKAVQEYIFSNIEQIIAKIADKLSVNAEEILEQIKETNFDGRLATKRRNNGREGITRTEEKQESDDAIVKQIQSRSLELESQGVSHKELVKQIFKLLENKNLSHERKEEIMENWIAYKKMKKSTRR